MVNTSSLVVVVAALGAVSTLAAPSYEHQQYVRDLDARDLIKDLEDRGLFGIVRKVGKLIFHHGGSGNQQQQRRRELDARGFGKIASSLLHTGVHAAEHTEHHAPKSGGGKADKFFKHAGKGLDLASKAGDVYNSFKGNGGNNNNGYYQRDFGLEGRSPRSASGASRGARSNSYYQRDFDDAEMWAREIDMEERGLEERSPKGSGGFAKAGKVLDLAGKAADVWNSFKGRGGSNYQRDIGDEAEMWARELEEVYARAADEFDLD